MNSDFSEDRFSTMALMVIYWICSLPVILLVIVPLFGYRIGAWVALAAFGLTLVLCWGICLPTLIRMVLDERRKQQ